MLHEPQPEDVVRTTSQDTPKGTQLAIIREHGSSPQRSLLLTSEAHGPPLPAED